MDNEIEAALKALREAIQLCEQFSMVRDSSGSVVTGAVIGKDGGIQIVKE